MSEQRDQWGETAEERHARILARDLAWMTYSEGGARDGVPRTEKDHGVFNAGYAAGRADYLPAAGVVSEEPEGTRIYAACWLDTNGVLNALESASVRQVDAEGQVTRWRAAVADEGDDPDRVVLCSRNIHPWLSVEQDTENRSER